MILDNKKYLVGLIIALLVAVAGTWYLLSSKTVSTETDNTATALPDQIKTTTATPAEQIAQLQKSGNVVIPKIQTETSAAITSLPTEIQKLLDSNPTDLVVSALVFNKTTSGFLIKYSMSETLEQADRHFAVTGVQQGWKIGDSQLFIGVGGLIELINDSYKVRVDTLLDANKNCQITITVVKI